ncbi:hypothetical protein BH09PSE5_BH09PSE5_50700 [soil metagenome]
MQHPYTETQAETDFEPADHGPGVPIARGAVGSVTMCRCGVVTVNLQYMSMRLEPGAFRELQGLLSFAQRRIDGDPSVPLLAPPRQADDQSMH